MNSQDTTPSAQSPTPTPTPTPIPIQDTSTAIAGFILAFLFAPLGLIFSIAGLKKAKQLDGATKQFGGVGRGLAIAGLIVSILGILFWVWVFFYYAFINSFEEAPARRTFSADIDSQSVRVVRDPLEDWGRPDIFLRQTFHYQPTTPARCYYYLSQTSVDRDSVEPDDWSSYAGPVAMGIQSGAYILARDCGKWRLVDNP